MWQAHGPFEQRPILVPLGWLMLKPLKKAIGGVKIDRPGADCY